MRTREIVHEQWRTFLMDFTQAHLGNPINVETIIKGFLGVKPQVHDRPLVGIVGAESTPPFGEWIAVIAGNSSAIRAVHSIRNPSRMIVAQEDDGRDVALQINSTDGSITMVRFIPPVEGIPPGFTVI